MHEPGCEPPLDTTHSASQRHFESKSQRFATELEHLARISCKLHLSGGARESLSVQTGSEKIECTLPVVRARKYVLRNLRNWFLR